MPLRGLITLSLFLTLSVYVSGQAKSNAKAPNTRALDELTRISSEIFNAGISGNKAVIERYLADTFLETDAIGEIHDKDWNLNNFLDSRTKMSFEIKDARVREYSEFAILYYLLSVKSESAISDESAGAKQAEVSQAYLRVSDTFIKTKSGWRLVASHRTRLREMPQLSPQPTISTGSEVVRPTR